MSRRPSLHHFFAVLLSAGLLIGAAPAVVFYPGLALDGEIDQLCKRLSRKLASVSYRECRDSELRTTGAHSIEGTVLALREYPPLAGRTARGRVLLIGGIHGDEYSSVSVVFKWMAILDRYHSGLFHWRIMPVLNPDGLLRQPSQRMNANGVDLNRNFPSPSWAEESQHYWVERTGRNPRRYPGTAPASEPEAAWLVAEIERFAPDVIVSVHAPHSVVDFDGPADPPRQLGNLHLKLLGTFPGSLGRYAGVHRGIPVVTIELAHAGLMPSPEEQLEIWKDLVQWLTRELPLSRSEPTAIAAEQ